MRKKYCSTEGIFPGDEIFAFQISGREDVNAGVHVHVCDSGTDVLCTC